MKYLFSLVFVGILLFSCNSSKSSIKGNSNDIVTVGDTIRISSDSLEYDIVIIEPGFNAFLITQPPQGYYGLTFLEIRNRMAVTEYNQRVINPSRYSPNLYIQQINYEPSVDYGLEVNYKLYNYFLFFQKKYNQRFTGFRN